MDLSQVPVDRSSTVAGRKQNEYLASLSRNELIKQLPIPTNDELVQSQLEQYGEPRILVGEDKADRRSRLANVMADNVENGKPLLSVSDTQAPASDSSDEEEEEFYTEGPAELTTFRHIALHYSLEAAKTRLTKQQELFSKSYLLESFVFHRRRSNKIVASYEALGTQSGFSRPVSETKFSPRGALLAVGDWSGQIKLLSTPDLNTEVVFGNNDGISSHTDRIGGIAWNPTDRGDLSSVQEDVCIASGSADNTIKLWSINGKLRTTFNGHEARVCNVDFYPTGQYIASASYDRTWRLWDVAAEKEILIQEGHAKEVFDVKFHPDGSMLGSVGLDAHTWLWDMRTGRSVMTLSDHIREIYSLDFSPNGYQLATGSADNTIKIWDIRLGRCMSTIPAHKAAVTSVQFFHGSIPSECVDKVQPQEPLPDNNFPTQGSFVLSCSNDQTVKIWSADDWKCLQVSEENSRLLSADISQNGQYIAAGRWDRNVKVWTNCHIN